MFTLGDEEYGIDILKVQEIRGYDSVTRIANAPEFIKGVINLRGIIVPIVDMRIKFHLGRVEYDHQTVVIILNVAHRVVGMVVDGVSDVLTLQTDQIMPAPEFGATLTTEYLTGLGTVDGRMLILMDIELMSSREMALIETLGGKRARAGIRENLQCCKTGRSARRSRRSDSSSWRWPQPSAPAFALNHASRSLDAIAHVDLPAIHSLDDTSSYLLRARVSLDRFRSLTEAGNTAEAAKVLDRAQELYAKSNQNWQAFQATPKLGIEQALVDAARPLRDDREGRRRSRVRGCARGDMAAYHAVADTKISPMFVAYSRPRRPWSRRCKSARKIARLRRNRRSR